MLKRAWRERYYGIAAVTAVLWSTQQSPGDVRTLRASQLLIDGTGVFFFTDRAKTGKPVGGALSVRAVRAIEAYLKKLGVELHGDAFLFLNRSAAAYSSDTLGDDFRDVRHMEFGPEETRMLADFRRSGAQEAFAGDAQPADASHAKGNTIATSNMLFATCNPVNMASVRKVHEARIKGRRSLREGGRTTRPALGQKTKGGTE